ncbi:hypothetical protein [Pelagerythrobacter sp.]|uniref:hypothetical protein n=1 Tax=Pelagerythrobacter sp. TaxID=2800702 RepID=UPI0035ADFCC6
MTETGRDSHAKAADRRKGDRRTKQEPFAGPDRRVGARRSGKDRRGAERIG